MSLTHNQIVFDENNYDVFRIIVSSRNFVVNSNTTISIFGRTHLLLHWSFMVKWNNGAADGLYRWT